MSIGLALTWTPATAADLVAHRGASFDAPENTLAATMLAWEQDADAVENDILLSRDGRLIVFHDGESAKRTTGRDVPIASLTQDEARQLDAGSWRGARFAGERIPLLEEQIASIPAGKRLFVEIKDGPATVPELQRVFAATGASADRITIISFHADTLRAVRRRLPGFPTLYLVGYDGAASSTNARGNVRASKLTEVIALARRARFTGLDLHHGWPLTAEDVRLIKTAGLELHVWTVNDVTIARHWIELGVASITTDRPGWLRAALKK